MNNPKIAAPVCGLLILYFGYSLFGADETPSTMLNALYWVGFILGIVGFLGAVHQLTRSA